MVHIFGLCGLQADRHFNTHTDLSGKKEIKQHLYFIMKPQWRSF